MNRRGFLSLMAAAPVAAVAGIGAVANIAWQAEANGGLPYLVGRSGASGRVTLATTQDLIAKMNDAAVAAARAVAPRADANPAA